MTAHKDLFKSPQAPSISDSRTLSVYPSCDFIVACGANEGDGLGISTDLMLDDIYMLRSAARQCALLLVRNDDGYEVATSSDLGVTGNNIHIDCSITLMDFTNTVIEALVLVEVSTAEHVENVYLLPLSPLLAKREYTLLRVDHTNAAQRMAQLACASFSRGTKITLATGEQCAVEDLAIGTPLLTRDNGVQPIRWIGQYTERATGAFAPIRILAGTLDNKDDLIVSPDHRLFFYQREDRLGTGRREIMVRACDLVNGQSVSIQEGGFVDYFQILFETHQVIYAGGIAVESTLMNQTTAALLENGTSADLLSNHARGNAFLELDVQNPTFGAADALDFLKRDTND